MDKKTALLVLAPGFEEIEALGTADILRRLDCRVLLTGLETLAVRGSHHITVTADVLFSEAPFDKADAIILPGGLPGATNLRDSASLTAVLQTFAEQGKTLAAICAAPIVLKHAGVANHTILTGYPGSEPLAEVPGLKFTGKMTEVDGNIITAKGPGATFLFAAEIARSFGVPDAEIEKVREGMFMR